MTNASTPQLGSSGRWQVTTETSCYLLDLDAMHATRVPDAGAGAADDSDPRPLFVSQLRRDHEPIPLLEVSLAEVGKPLMLLLDIRGDGVATLRRSTIVRDIVTVTGPASPDPVSAALT